MPAAAIWKAVAEILTAGLSSLPVTAAYAALIGGVLGIVMELLRVFSKGRFGISAIGIGLATVIPFSTCLAMAFGSFVFWYLGRRYPDKDSKVNRVVVQNQEPICAGVIAGAALMGIGLMAYMTFVLAD